MRKPKQTPAVGQDAAAERGPPHPRLELLELPAAGRVRDEAAIRGLALARVELSEDAAAAEVVH